MKYFFATLLLPLLFGNSAVHGQSGPGGIGLTANLAFWLDANAQTLNSPVDQWQDISGNGIQTFVNGNPTFVSGILNGMGAVRFDGTGDEVSTNFSINAVDNDQLSVIAVYVPRINHAGSIWGEDNGAWDRFLTDVTLVPQLNSTVGAGYDPEEITHPSTNIPNLFVTDAATLATVVYDDGFWNGTHVYIGGQLARSFESNAADYYYAYAGNGYSNFYVGAIGSSGLRFNGDIAEVIVFTNDITQTQRIIIENYLSAKYGLPLASSIDLYNEDDAGFDFNVAGIGSLNGSIQNNSRGTGLVRMWSPSNLGDTEFLFWGDNNGMLQATNVSDIPAGVQARSNRMWRVSEVNTSATPVDVGSVNISFVLENIGPIDASHLRLLVDADNDGLFADETPIAGAISLGNNEYAFMGVTALADNFTFTISTSNALQTPLPLELKFFEAKLAGTEVKLTWETLVEKDVLSFGISRSKNGIDWTDLTRVDATGAGEYVYNDINPLPGRSYYKLSSRDIDTEEKTIKVITLDRSKEQQSIAFPNPFAHRLTISHHSSAQVLSVLNQIGVDHTSRILIVSKTENETVIDLSVLPHGPYIIRLTDGQSIRVVKSSLRTF